MTTQLHKQRWFDRNILGKRPGNDCVFYFHSTEANSPAKAILEPLRRGEIRLTDADIRRIPAKALYIDIFVLLLQHGYARPTQNKRLFLLTIDYYIRLQLIPYFPFAIRIPGGLSPVCREIGKLLQNDADILLKFMYVLPQMLQKKFSEYEDLEGMLVPVLLELQESNAQRELCWYSKEGLLIDMYKKTSIGKKFLPFLNEVFYPRLHGLLKEERKAKYARSNIFKEELMATVWHPDRVERIGWITNEVVWDNIIGL